MRSQKIAVQVVIIFFLLAAIVQLIFLILFLATLIKKDTSPKAAAEVPVSVIVCAHNEEQNLRELIPLLLEQEYSGIEVIIVDDRSSDETREYLLQTMTKHPRLRMVTVNHRPEHITGKKYALTLGIRAANNEILLLTDADCRPAGQHWIREMVSSFGESTSLVLGYSPYLRADGLLNAFIRFEGLLTGVQYTCLALLGKPYMGVGRNIAYRKSLFLANKGFSGHHGIMGGDDDLFVNAHATRDNTALALGKAALMYSRPHASWKGFFTQKLRHLSVGRFYKFSDRLVIGAFASSWIGFWLALFGCILSGNAGILYVIVSLLITRWIFLISLFVAASRRLGDPFEAWKIPLLDIMYAIYYLVTGLSALGSKKIRWKKI